MLHAVKNKAHVYYWSTSKILIFSCFCYPIFGSSLVLNSVFVVFQTAHTPLQLPYTYFGLGSNLNFIDSLTVKVTNASSQSQIRTFTQVKQGSLINDVTRLGAILWHHMKMGEGVVRNVMSCQGEPILDLFFFTRLAAFKGEGSV